jgi:hypothetical protein
MSRNYYVSGQFNVTCDVCSRKIKAGYTKRRWDGFQVCPDCYEERHPQDFVRARQDKITVPFSRPIPTLLFTNVPYINIGDSVCTFSGRQAIPNEGIPGCMIPSKINSGL